MFLIFAAMIYPSDFEQKIGFDRIRVMLAEYCSSSLGEQNIDHIEFSSDHDFITLQLEQTEEFRQVLTTDRPFPAQNYFNLLPELDRIRIEGTYIQQEELFNLKSSLVTILDCVDYFKKSEEGLYLRLKEIVAEIDITPEILNYIQKIIDDKGRIRDNASPELLDIRKQLRRSQGEITSRVEKTLNHVKKAGYSPDDVEATIRGGRMVIPVLAVHKRKVKGFIHDESASGQTVYIEPTEAFDLNNKVRELEIDERREIIRILTKFTDYLRPHLDPLKHSYLVLGKLDFIRAKAILATEINGIMPGVLEIPFIDWHDAYHPLLYLSHKSRNKITVPLTIRLDENNRILVISGPNAGGKSVCLKTVGLLQYMVQCGLLVPMEENSKCGIFGRIFIDIGDEQSLENDLSTYSSHLINIKYFIENTDKESLILIDEFGSGTEPQLGGAIAETALELFNSKKAMGVVTTHYANLKLLADEQKGIVNGAMLFDTKKIQPLYQLKIGKPGSSFAFEIAKNIGLPKSILKKAGEKTGHKQLDFEQQLQQLEIEKKEIEQQQEQVKVADEFLSEMIDKYQDLLHELESSKASIIDAAKKEAIDLIDQSNRIIEKTIREIREVQADKQKTKNARKELRSFSEKIRKKEKDVKSTPAGPADTEKVNEIIRPGDRVKLLKHQTTGEVLEVKENTVTVLSGNIKLRIPSDQLVKVSRSDVKEQKVSPSSSYRKVVDDLNEKVSRFNLSIDIRGKRADEALTLVRHYIDDAILLNIKEVRIVHGKGDGILRSVVREFLDTIEEVRNYSDEHVERGGSGITIVQFK